MTVQLFIGMFVIGAFVCAVLTQAIKTAFYNAGKEASPNLLALFNAVVVGGFGTAVAYILMGIEWTPANITCLILMSICVWMGSMVGYGEVKEMLEQVQRWFGNIKKD